LGFEPSLEIYRDVKDLRKSTRASGDDTHGKASRQGETCVPNPELILEHIYISKTQTHVNLLIPQHK
jgi:hypothetical protein